MIIEIPPFWIIEFFSKNSFHFSKQVGLGFGFYCDKMDLGPSLHGHSNLFQKKKKI
jgi:hypothetical protein